MSSSRSSRHGFNKIRQAFDAAETSSVDCYSSPSFGLEQQIAEFISTLLEECGEQFAYAWILLSIGIEPDRLNKLSRTKDSYITQSTDVHLNQVTGILSYFVNNNGNHNNLSSTGKDRVYIQLPRFIHEILSRRSEHHPFTDALKFHNNKADAFRKRHGGIALTANVITRTFRKLVKPFVQDNLLASAISGAMKTGYGAKSHYYRFCNIEVNERFQISHHCLVNIMIRQASASARLKAMLSSSNFVEPKLNGSIGSRKIIERRDIDKLTSDIRQAADSAFLLANQETRFNRLRQFSRYINLLSVHLFLMQRYSYALREVGNRTEIHTNEYMDIAIIVDKYSKLFREARMAPRNEIEKQQQQINKRNIAELLYMAETMGVCVEYDVNVFNRGYAIRTVISKQGHSSKLLLTLKCFKQKDYNNILKGENIHNPDFENVNRHYLARELRTVVPEQMLDQLLNHNRSGHDLLTPFSTASIKVDDFKHLAHRIATLFPYQLLDHTIDAFAFNDPTALDLYSLLKKAIIIPQKNPKDDHSRKPARFSILPSNRSEITHLPAIIMAYDYLWNHEFAKHDDHSLSMIGIALSLGLELGWGEPYLSEVFSRLKWQDLDHEFNLTTPIDHDSDDSPIFSPPLSMAAKVILKGLYLHSKPKPDDWIFVADEQNIENRVTAVKSRLRVEHNALKKSFKMFAPNLFLPHINVIFRIARINAILETGIEPFHTSLTTDWPTPITHSAKHQRPLLCREYAVPGQHQKWGINLGCTFRKRSLPCKLPMSNDFLKAATGHLQDLRQKLTEITNKPRPGQKYPTLKSKIATEEIHQYIDELIEKADDLNPDGTSALHLALEWVRSRYRYGLCEKNLKASSVTTYLSELFTSRLLTLDQAEDLTAISAETLVEHLTEWFDSDSLEDQTADKLCGLASEVIAFGSLRGFFPDLEIPVPAGKSGAYGTRRADLICPRQLDNLIRPLMESSNRADQEHACVLILGHYAGLRDSEIRRLALGDLITSPKCCSVCVRYGKSSNARRVVPLHFITHPIYVAFLNQCRLRRLAEFQKIASHRISLKKITFLGPESTAHGYSRHEVSGPVIARLKSAFGPDTDLHLLRHGFGSWMVLRLMALNYPQIVPELSNQEHWMFHEKIQHRLRLFFTLRTGILIRFESNNLIRIGRLIGHSGVRTLFQYYVQTMVPIHNEMVARSNLRFTSRWVSGETATALLFGKLGSPATYAKLLDKTLGGIYKHLFTATHLQQETISQAVA